MSVKEVWDKTTIITMTGRKLISIMVLLMQGSWNLMTRKMTFGTRILIQEGVVAGLEAAIQEEIMPRAAGLVVGRWLDS
jgi:hypothetical protein